jgi:hypothetical protein
MEKGGILPSAVIEGLQSAVVVEDYPNANRGPSVLVLFPDAHGNVLHAVWGLSNALPDIAVLITVYRPDPLQWTPDFLKRLRP